MNTAILSYLGIFILLPGFVLALMATVLEFHLYLTLFMLFLFGCGIVIGPAFLPEPEDEQ